MPECQQIPISRDSASRCLVWDQRRPPELWSRRKCSEVTQEARLKALSSDDNQHDTTFGASPSAGTLRRSLAQIGLQLALPAPILEGSVRLAQSRLLQRSPWSGPPADPAR